MSPVQPDGLLGARHHGHDHEAEQVQCVDGEEGAEGDVEPHGGDERRGRGGEDEGGRMALVVAACSRKKRDNRVERSAG